MDLTQFKKGIYLVNLLGIIYNPKTKQILIGRRVNDPNLKDLSWVFPGGRPDYKNDLDACVYNEIHENTGLDVIVKDVIFAKTYPEAREFLSIYYYCEIGANSGTEQAMGNLKELKWIKPSEVTEYFTTSVHPRVIDYLRCLN